MIVKDNGLEYELNKLDLKDKDILIVKCSHTFTEEQRINFTRRMKEKINKDIFIIMMDNSAEIETLSDENLKKICKERGLIND